MSRFLAVAGLILVLTVAVRADGAPQNLGNIGTISIPTPSGRGTPNGDAQPDQSPATGQVNQPNSAPPATEPNDPILKDLQFGVQTFVETARQELRKKALRRPSSGRTQPPSESEINLALTKAALEGLEQQLALERQLRPGSPVITTVVTEQVVPLWCWVALIALMASLSINYFFVARAVYLQGGWKTVFRRDGSASKPS